MPRGTRGVPAGLVVKKHNQFGYFVIHAASGLPLHPYLIKLQRDAIAGAEEVGRLGIDWTQSAAAVNKAIERIPGGRAAAYGSLVKRQGH